MRGHLLLLSALMLFVSCQQQRMIVESRYLSRARLASSFVGTPDPRQYCPTVGQELTFTWRLPEFDNEEDLKLLLTVRFRNRNSECLEVPVNRFRGSFTYQLLDDDYWEANGIVTYKIELYAGENVIDCWYHQVWSEEICFDTYEAEENFLDGAPWQL